MHTPLARFQDDFAQALFADDVLAPASAALTAQPGFSVYRNTVLKAGIDTLQANFPSVLRLVGEEWFRAAAALHVRAEPPRDPCLLFYGDGFPAFLATFEPAMELPYLPGVAQLDRCWTRAHAAADTPVLRAATLSALPPAALGATVLHPRPATQWQWFAGHPVYTIWQRNRAANEDDSALAWQGEGALLTRPGAVVQWTSLDAAGCAFLDACAAGATLADAAGAALAATPDADIAALLAQLMNAGAFDAALPANR